MRRAHIYEVAVKLLGLIGTPAHIDGGMGYVFAYNIGYFVYLPCGGGYETQLLLHVAYGGHCSAQIDGGQANHDTRKHGTRLMWYAVYQVHHHGVYYAHYERGGKAPNQRKLEADIAVYVEAVIGIIPPLGVKQLLQHPTGDVFNYRGNYNGA